MDFPRDNYMHYAQDVSENYGFFFDKPEAALGDGICGGIDWKALRTRLASNGI